MNDWIASTLWLGKEDIVLHNQLLSPLSLSLVLSLSMSVTQMHTRVYETLLEVQECMFSSVIQYS